MERKFSTVITLALTGFTVGSLILILGTLYGTLNNAMVKEYRTQLYADQSEISATLENRLQLLESQLRQLSLNNALRVNLMLDVRNQALEILANTNLLEDAARLLLHLPAVGLLPVAETTSFEDDEALFPRMPDQDPGRRLFVNSGNGRIVCVFSMPVMRKDELLGTLLAVYEPGRDRYLQNRLRDGALLYVRDSDRIISLEPGGDNRAIALDELQTGGAVNPGLYAHTDLSLVNLKQFPQLYYAASTRALTAKQERLVLKLGVIGVAMLAMAALVATILARKVSQPLQSMADQAMTIGSGSGSGFFDVSRIRYAEFKRLANGFNELLRNLLLAQEKELKAKNFLDAIISTAADPIFVKDSRFRWVILNDAYCRFVGKPRQDLIGRTDFDLFPQKEARFFRQKDVDVVASQKEHAYESRMTDAHGDVHHIWVKKNLYQDPDSRETYIVGIVRDITRSKQLEAELARHRDRLTEMVSERTSELMATNEKLIREIEERHKAEQDRMEMETRLRRARQMEAIGTLAGGVAHDLNNILSGIVSYPDLILMDMPADSPMRKPVSIMQRSGKKAAAIVQDMLTLSRRGNTASDAVDLNSLIDEYLESPEFKNLLQDHHAVSVRSALANDLPPVMGSEVHLSKTIMNLTTNAIEAIAEAGVVTIGSALETLDRPLQAYETIPEGTYVVLSVSDSGSGIDAQDIERIFEPFFTRKKMGRSGTGLGMAVVWGVVKEHNGYINVASTLGGGSTFSLYFPAGQPAADPGVAPIPQPSYQGNGEWVLVVDDTTDQREIASAMVRKLGYRAQTVASGEAAVEMARNHPFDLILLDMIMDPGIDGYETYRRIRKIHPNQKAIITSGFSKSDRVRKLNALGVRKYLRKPYSLNQLGETMSLELRGK